MSTKETLKAVIDDILYLSKRDLSPKQKATVCKEFLKIPFVATGLYFYSLKKHVDNKKSDTYTFNNCVSIAHCFAVVNSEIKHDL